jgi:hypothetical protein
MTYLGSIRADVRLSRAPIDEEPFEHLVQRERASMRRTLRPSPRDNHKAQQIFCCAALSCLAYRQCTVPEW